LVFRSEADPTAAPLADAPGCLVKRWSIASPLQVGASHGWRQAGKEKGCGVRARASAPWEEEDRVMRIMVRKVLAGAVVAATVAGGSFGAVQARTLPVSNAEQVAGATPVEDVGYYRRRGVGFAVGAAALGFGLGAIAASRPYYGYGYGYGYPAYGYGYGYPGYSYGGYYPRRVVLAPRFYGYRRAFYGPRFRYGRGGRRFR
jgi:hypothetical protein